MSVNVQVKRNGNENSMNVLRRFRNRLRSSGVLNHARELRFQDRSPSDYVTKKKKLKQIENRKRRERLYKLGKTSEH